MARKLRPSAWAFAVAAWDVWRRLPPKQRKQALALARKHGPKVVKHGPKVVKGVASARRATKKK